MAVTWRHGENYIIGFLYKSKKQKFGRLKKPCISKNLAVFLLDFLFNVMYSEKRIEWLINLVIMHLDFRG